MKNSLQKLVLLSVGALFLLSACGGGSGLGPTEIKKREDQLKAGLTVDWAKYRSGDYANAIQLFAKTLEQADLMEGIDAVKYQVKAEAHNGIGWSYFQTQHLDSADVAFRQSTVLDRRSPDAWAGWAGVTLARAGGATSDEARRRLYSDAAQYARQALELDSDYDSEDRVMDEEVTGSGAIGHDRFTHLHLRLLLAEAYFQLGRYSAVDQPDPTNAAAQMSLISDDMQTEFNYTDPGRLLEDISAAALVLRETF